MSKQILARYGLKWNPFSPDIPIEAVWAPPKLKHFCRRVGQLSREGGFALLTGDAGTGKSVGLRLVHDGLSEIPDVLAATLTRPQANVTDFYREIGSLFGVPLSACNRWGGFKALRERWKDHIENTLYRPVLLIDEAQFLQGAALAELRLLASTDFDSRSILTVVFSGDRSFLERLRSDELYPLGSRIRVRLATEPLTREQIAEFLRFALEKAGNAALMTSGLIETLAVHAAGNLRTITIMANELLHVAAEEDANQLDEALYLEVFGPQPKKNSDGAKGQGRKTR
jgi:type II secretory pathway predicted ATPase ExeA